MMPRPAAVEKSMRQIAATNEDGGRAPAVDRRLCLKERSEITPTVIEATRLSDPNAGVFRNCRRAARNLTRTAAQR